MTAIAGDDLPEEWKLTDQIHLEAWAYHNKIDTLAEHNALVWFTRELLDNHTLTDEETFDLQEFLDTATTAHTIIEKYEGKHYIADYIDQLENGDPDE